MKRVVLVLGLVLLLALALIGAPATFAGEVGLCDVDPGEIAIGETATVTCHGFSPNTWVFVYAVEPDGTAMGLGQVKSDLGGTVSFPWTNGFAEEYNLQLGKWTLVVEELGLGGAKVHQAVAYLTMSGAGEHVSGASLWMDPSTVIKGELSTLYGSGFAPYEMVTVWYQQPTYCSSWTEHYVDGKNGATFENVGRFGAFSALSIFTIKADASGSFATSGTFFPEECEGTYRFAAKGNSSGWGAYVDVVATGDSVATNAWLTTDKSSVYAFNDTITFFASGFGSYEQINCWTTSPEGRAVPFGIFGSLQPAIKMDAGGSGSFQLTTGAHIGSPDDPFFQGVDPELSEGSLGQWAMTCHGLDSGAVAIARYWVVGFALDP